nr:allophanate hydrolase subunit 2 family protein [Myxococcota bacterium]
VVGRADESELAEDDGAVRRVRAGERVELGWDGSTRARYVALRGGIDVPVVLGGRGTLVSARLGGLEGRALRKGDVIRSASDTGAAPALASGSASGAAIRLLPGPDLARFAPGALDALLGTGWSLSPRSDRTGTRLVGTAIAYRRGAPDARTTPMIAGAIELPPSGEPIVLGPDHPTTGGYPVVAVIARVDLGRFHAIALGREVRFGSVDAQSARALWRERSAR